MSLPLGESITNCPRPTAIPWMKTAKFLSSTSIGSCPTWRRLKIHPEIAICQTFQKKGQQPQRLSTREKLDSAGDSTAFRLIELNVSNSRRPTTSGSQWFLCRQREDITNHQLSMENGCCQEEHGTLMAMAVLNMKRWSLRMVCLRLDLLYLLQNIIIARSPLMTRESFSLLVTIVTTLSFWIWLLKNGCFWMTYHNQWRAVPAACWATLLMAQVRTKTSKPGDMMTNVLCRSSSCFQPRFAHLFFD